MKVGEIAFPSAAVVETRAKWGAGDEVELAPAPGNMEGRSVV